MTNIVQPLIGTPPPLTYRCSDKGAALAKGRGGLLKDIVVNTVLRSGLGPGPLGRNAYHPGNKARP